MEARWRLLENFNFCVDQHVCVTAPAPPHPTPTAPHPPVVCFLPQSTVGQSGFFRHNRVSTTKEGLNAVSLPPTVDWGSGTLEQMGGLLARSWQTHGQRPAHVAARKPTQTQTHTNIDHRPSQKAPSVFFMFRGNPGPCRAPPVSISAPTCF